MGLADVFARNAQATGGRGDIEYGSDGQRPTAFTLTPWPGVINDAMEGQPVGRAEAEGMPGFGRGVELITGVISQLQPLLYEDEHLVDEPTIRLPTPPLLLNPDPAWHGLDSWLAAIVADLVWDGNGFAYKGVEVSDYRGYPLRLPLIPADNVSWVPRQWNDSEADPGNVYQVTGNSGVTNIEPADMFHALISPQSGKRMGRGLLDRYQDTLRLIRVTEQAQYVMMKDGKPLGIVSVNMDIAPSEAKDYKQAFLDSMREGSVSVMANATFNPVQWNSADLAMVPTREFNLRLASDALGISPYLLGVPSESRVYSNMETEWSNFIKVTLGRYLATLESCLSACYPKDKTVRFDVDQLLRSDASARWAVYKTASEVEAITVDEIRQAERLPPLTAAQKAGMAKAAPAPAPAPAAPAADPNAAGGAA